MRRVTFQDWVTLTLASSGAEAEQLSGLILDAAGLESVTVLPDITHRQGGQLVSVYLETALTLAGPWVRMASALATRTPVIYSREAGASNLLGSYLRWVAVATAASPVVTFKLDCNVVELPRITDGKGAVMYMGQPRVANSVQQPEQRIRRFEPQR